MMLLTALPRLVSNADCEAPCAKSGLLMQLRLNDGRRLRFELLLGRPNGLVSTLMPVLQPEAPPSALQLPQVPMPQLFPPRV